MRKTICALLAVVACSFMLATGCGKKEESVEKASAQHNILAENDSFEDDASSEKESATKEDTTTVGDEDSSEETPAEESSSIENVTTTGDDQSATENLQSSSDGGAGTAGSSGVVGNNSNVGNNNSGNSGNKNNQGSNTDSNNMTVVNEGNVLADKNSDKVLISYGGNTSTEEKKLAQAVIAKIIKSGMSEFEKVKAIHDYMVMNIDYDYANYLADTIPNSSYTITGALKNKYAVCSGYAKTFKLLCELAGLECTYVSGTAGGPHAWNQVKIDGKWYNVDVTWDDPVSENKEFNDHTFTCYSYFLISDTLMNKNHKASGSTHTCSSSLNMKAYEVGAPWGTHTYVRNDAELKAALQKVISANASSVSIMWDTDWVKSSDMSKKMKSMMLECDIADDFHVAGGTGLSIKNTTLYCMKYNLKLKNGVYSANGKLKTKDEVKKLIKSLKNGGETTVPVVNSLVNSDVFYELAVWAYEELNVTVHMSEAQIPVNSTAKSVYVFVQKNNYDSEETYCVEKLSDIDAKVTELYASGKSFRVMYRYGDELGRLSEAQIKSYIEKNKAPGWAKNFCYERYDISCDEYVCVVNIKFYNPYHSTAGSSWEYEKVPTCISDGIMVLKCSKCKCVTQSHKQEATGVHDVSWVYESGTARHLKCKNCSYTGKTEYLYGDVWGYYDDGGAAEFFKAINKSRESAVYYHIDYDGTFLGTETPPQLTLDTALSEQLRTYVLEICRDRLNGKGTTPAKNIAYQEGGTDVNFVCGNMFARGINRDYLESIYLKKAGVTCFYFDTDGTGLKMKPIWCVHFAE